MIGSNLTTNSFIPLHKSEKASELLERQEKALKEAVDSIITKTTPKNAVFNRQGRGKRTFTYIQSWWLIDQLNLLFDWDWDWVIDDQGIGTGHVWVRGTLVVRSTSDSGVVREIKKSAYGGQDIKFYGSDNANAGKSIDIGDDLKGASTDAFKKAASYLGIAADIYGPHEQQEVEELSNKPDQTILKAINFRVGKIGFSKEDFEAWLIDGDQKDVNPQSLSLDDLGKDEAPKVLQKLIKAELALTQNGSKN